MALLNGSRFQTEVTLVSNAFIDEAMAGASGEYVKIYLYLLRHGTGQKSIGEAAEALHCTEGDVQRAITYWKRVGVLEEDAGGTGAAGLSGLAAGSGNAGRRAAGLAAGSGNAGSLAASLAAGSGSMGSRVAGSGNAGRRAVSLADDEEFSQLLYVAQKYMNRAFTQRDSQVFSYLYGELKLSVELLEYLVETCVQNGHTSIRYMETVALNWHERGLTTVEAAKAYSGSYTKDSFAVMKAFGLNDRRPAEPEQRFIDSWFKELGFSRELVLEACSRTIQAIHSPSFSYANKILRDWKAAGVKRLSDVEELDLIRKQQEEKKRSEGAAGTAGQSGGRAGAGSQNGGTAGGQAGSRSGGQRRSGAPNRFHNFDQSGTDYDSLMMKKLQEKMKE